MPSHCFFLDLLVFESILLFYVKFNKVYNALVVNQTRAVTCDESLGICKGCDKRCKTKHGPSCISKCDGEVGNLKCTCTYECGPPPPPKICNDGLSIAHKNIMVDMDFVTPLMILVCAYASTLAKLCWQNL